MLEELWVEVCIIVQEVMTKTIPKKNKCKKAKWLSEEALQIAEKRSERQRKQRSNCQQPLDHIKSKGVPEKIYFCFTDYAKAFDCVDHN